jgi:DNA-binding MarR family transcriptional regulator
MTEIKPQNVFYTAGSYRPEDSVGHLMKQIITLVSQDIERQLAHTDLTNAQWVPLFKIHFGQANTVAELARHCHLDAGAMTRLLDRLEAKGLCKRVRSETDRRVVKLELTPAGTQAASEIPEILSGVQNAHLAGFSAEEFETLRAYLRRILANAQTLAGQTLDTPSNPAESDAAL